jgi:hypothetical protein
VTQQIEVLDACRDREDLCYSEVHIRAQRFHL